MSLVSTSELSTFTQLSIPAGTATTEAQAACDRATALVRAYCRRKINQTNESVTVALSASNGYQGRGIIEAHTLDTILLPETPVQSVTSVTINSVAVTGYALQPDGSILLPRTYPAGTTATVVYVSGFGANDWRFLAAKAVAVRVAARLWTNPDARTAYTGPGDLNYQSAPELVRLLTMDERAMLDPAARVDGIA